MTRVSRRWRGEFRLLGLLNLPGTDDLRMARLVHKTSLGPSLRPGRTSYKRSGFPAGRHRRGQESAVQSPRTVPQVRTMQFLGLDLRKIAPLAALCAGGYVAGCGNSCFVGYSINGNGGVIVKAGDPPPACMLNQAQGKVRVALAKIAKCENCAPVGQLQHMLVALRSIEIHSEGEADDAGWVDIAPTDTANPRTLDLVGDPLSDFVVVSATVPAGSYDLLRLRFAPDMDAREPEDDPGTDHCGSGIANCLIMSDGRMEPLRIGANSAEVLTRMKQPLLVLPNRVSQLRVHLATQPNADISAVGSKAQVLVLEELSITRDEPAR